MTTVSTDVQETLTVFETLIVQFVLNCPLIYGKDKLDILINCMGPHLKML
jgi:hypothetical protein